MCPHKKTGAETEGENVDAAQDEVVPPVELSDASTDAVLSAVVATGNRVLKLL